MLSALSIKGKLFTAFGLGLISIFVIAFIAVFSLANNFSLEKEIRNIDRIRIQAVRTINTINEMKSWVNHAAFDHGDTRESVKNGKEIIDRLNELVSQRQNTLFANDIDNLERAVKAYTRAMEQDYLPRIADGSPTAALSIYSNKILDLEDKANAAVSVLTSKYGTRLSKLVSELDVQSSISVIISTAIITMIITAIAAVVIQKYIVSHTLKIKSTAIKIEHGDFNLNLDSKDIPKDEIGDIYHSFVSIANTLTKTVARVIAVSTKINSISHDVHHSAETITDGASRASNQSLSVSAAADQMVATTTDIAKNCHTAQQTSEGAKRETRAGVDKVRATVARIREQSIQTQEDSQKVLRLAEQSQSIASIVSTIDDIAAQTNLLALNAAIEAARAGEAGRGFAVVADEVRALASRTSKSTQEITAMVKSVQEDSKTATDSMKNSVEQMESMATHAGELEETLNNIMSSVDTVNMQISNISAAAEEQTTASSEISSNMQGISEMAQQSVDVCAVMLETSSDASNLVATLIDELGYFKINQNEIPKL